MPELYGKSLDRDLLMVRVGHLQQAAGIRLLEMADGAERGVRVIEVRTGTGFIFEIVVDRGFDIGRCEVAGVNLAWHSPTGFAGPWYAEHDEFGFHRTFGGGLLTTCGLEHSLLPAVDTAEQYRFPPQRQMAYGLHGRVSTTPAVLRGYGESWQGDELLLWAEGEVRQAMVFGEVLTLRRRITARVGESSLRIADEVRNDGHQPTPHMVLYHMNFGWPLVDDGARLEIPAEDVAAADGSGGELVAVPDYRTVSAPDASFIGQVYQHDMRVDADGFVRASIVNDKLDVRAYQHYRQDTLPHHLTWRMLGAGTYVIGLEPSTNRLDGRLPARTAGELTMLEPGQSRYYELELGATRASAEGVA